jgi:hypothetical protein
MAKYRYDVDKITRLIDVHKSFPGGLKTVDTDDSLKDVYLREAENISLSEFNFVEKRYGLHKNAEHAPWGSIENASSKLQGYFEYYVDANTVHKIIAFEGRFYVNQGSGFEEVELFSTPTGEVIDLSEIGVYTNEDVDSATDFSSVIQFGTQAPWFYTGNPNGVQLGVQGNIIHASNGTIYSNNGGPTLNTTWVAISGSSFPFPGGLTQGNKYYDTRTDRLYVWNSTTGTTGILTLLEDIYAADFQTTRPVEGVRIDDKLYIATGTYPVYYKGDGKIYVFEQYEMSDIDVEELGYDLNAINIADFFDVPNAPVNGYKGTDVAGAQLIEIRDVHKNYKVGHTNSIPNLILSVDFGLADVASLNEWSTGTYDFNSSLTNPYGTWSGGDPTSGGWKRKAELLVKVYTKLSSELSYPEEELEGTEYNYTEINNKYSNDKKSNVNGYLAQAINDIPVFKATLPSLTPNLYDFKVELYLLETGWLYTEDGGVTVGSRIIKKQSFEIVSFRVFPEELTDYLEEPIVTIERGVHACNRVIEHNGRLGFFGNPTLPDWVFFSTAGARNYFPSRYSLQFTNELQEEVTAINRFMNILIVQSPSYTWGIKGDVPFPVSLAEGEIYRKITINPTIGCIAPKSVKNVRNQLYFLSKEGVFTLRALFAEDNRYNVDPIDRNIYNIVPRDTNAVSAYFDDQYWLHFPNTGETLRYYVDKKAWVRDRYQAWNSFGGIHKYINTDGTLRFITELSQLETGNPLKVFDVEVDYSLPTDLTKNITSRMTTSYLNQDYPFHPKNYKEAKFDFAIQNEYNTSNQQLPISSYAETVNYVQFNASLIDRHFYSITFEPDEVTAPVAYTVTIDSVEVGSGTVTTDGTNLSTIRFMSNKTGAVTVRITMTGAINTTNMSADSIVLYDSTYDHTVTFNTMVLSEEGTLNIDPINSYTSADVALPIELGTRLGNWVFGTSNFGNVIVAVKTVKLAGRGYNSKISIIENSKSKWTLESLGITYKMKKARSR